jgi:hypothetical protein
MSAGITSEDNPKSSSVACMMAHGNLSNSIKGFDVFFKNVSPEAYERPSFGYQATDEIIQELLHEGLIERDTQEYIPLTQKGLVKCKEDCC